MAKPNGVQSEILQILGAHGALQPREIIKHSALPTDNVQVSNALFRLKSAGLVERANNQCWRVTDAGRTEARLSAKDGAQVPAPATPVVKESLTTAAPPRLQDDIEPTGRKPLTKLIERQANKAFAAQNALQRAAQQAQDALDAYVWEVGDAAVLEPLMAARDAASQALAAYEARP